MIREKIVSRRLVPVAVTLFRFIREPPRLSSSLINSILTRLSKLLKFTLKWPPITSLTRWNRDGRRFRPLIVLLPLMKFSVTVLALTVIIIFQLVTPLSGRNISIRPSVLTRLIRKR